MHKRFGRLFKSLLLLAIAGTMPVAWSLPVKADSDPSPWLNSALPSLTKVSDVGSAELTQLDKSLNADCQTRDIIIKPERVLPLPPYIQTKDSVSSCVTDTAYGAVGDKQYLQRPGSTVYGSITTNNGSSARVIPIPYSSTGIVMSGGTYNGDYLWFVKNLDTRLESSVIYTGEVTHKLPTPYNGGLRDASGQLLAARADTVGFSANGQWMIVDIPNIATVRVNTETYEILPFGDALNYNIGIGVGLRTAISPDGRFAAVASNQGYEVFKVYDLATCGAVPSYITTKVSCASRDLLPFVNSKVANFNSIFNMRFRGDYTLDMNISSLQNGVRLTSRQLLLAAGQTAANFDYLALGDSFAAGEGAYQYKSITDTADNKCHLSQRSYPYLISSALNFGQYESVACSGAVIEDVLNISEDYTQKHTQAKDKSDPQYSEEVMNGFLPGYRAQKLFTERYRPSIISLSMGGNDVGFNDKIIRCVDTDTCYSSYEDRLEIVNEINAQFYRLTDMYNQIKAGTDPRSKLYVIGYPQIAAIDGNCALNVHLNNDEIIFSQQLVGYLNSVIKTAAANAGAFYVDVEDAFAGHKMCETDSWSVAVNGLTAGNDIVNLPFIHGPVGNESFHPNALGHELFKTKILERTSNFTAVMPKPDPTAVINDAPTTLPFLQAPKSNRAVKLIRNITGTDQGVLHYGETWVQSYNSVSPFIKAGSTVKAWLNSDPTYLGAFTVSPSGNLNISATVPNNVPVGFHTLHIYGKNTTDEDVDLYQTVYVGARDAAANCGVPLSGVDADKDGIDDACDPIISQPPPVVIPVPLPVPPHADPPVQPPIISPPPTTDLNPLPPPVTPPPSVPPAPDPVVPPIAIPPISPPPPPIDNPIVSPVIIPNPIVMPPILTPTPVTPPPTAQPNPNNVTVTNPIIPTDNPATTPTISPTIKPTSLPTNTVKPASTTTIASPATEPATDPQSPLPQVAAATTEKPFPKIPATTNAVKNPTSIDSKHSFSLWVVLTLSIATLLLVGVLVKFLLVL